MTAESSPDLSELRAFEELVNYSTDSTSVCSDLSDDKPVENNAISRERITSATS